MRAVAIATLLVACTSEPKFVMRPLPPLVEPEQLAQRPEIVVSDIGLVAGEQWIWDIQVRGFSIGRVELSVSETEIRSHFRTGALASAFASVGHDLVTLIDRAAGRPETATERIDFAGKLRQFSTQFAGTRTHSFHTALGLIRAWAHPDARAGFVDVVHADKIFRLELERPIAQQDMLRVDGRVVGEDVDLRITVWLDGSKLPTRIEVRDGEDRVTAELIAS